MGMPTVYKFDDPNAPQNNGTKSAFYDLMKAVLVDGYGTKPGAGWEVAHASDAEYEYFAFRINPVTGSGRVLMFKYSGALSSAKRDSYYIYGAEDASAADSPILPFENPLYAPYNYLCHSNVSSGLAWCIVADDRFFYAQFYNKTAATFNPDAESNDYMSMFAFGDFIPFEASDSWATVWICGVRGNQQGTLPKGVGSFSATALYNGCVCRAIDGAEGAKPAAFTSYFTNSCYYGSPDWVYGDPLNLCRPILFDDLGIPTTMRGVLPGLYHGHGSNNGTKYGHMKPYTIDGKEYILFRCYTSGVLVNVSDEWNYGEFVI